MVNKRFSKTWLGSSMSGSDHASKVVGSWPVDRVESDTYGVSMYCGQLLFCLQTTRPTRDDGCTTRGSTRRCDPKTWPTTVPVRLHLRRLLDAAPAHPNSVLSSSSSSSISSVRWTRSWCGRARNGAPSSRHVRTCTTPASAKFSVSLRCRSSRLGCSRCTVIWATDNWATI